MNMQSVTVTTAACEMKSAEQTAAELLKNSDSLRRHFPLLGAMAPFRRAVFRKRTKRASLEITQLARPIDEI
jgi:hypothetical protein